MTVESFDRRRSTVRGAAVRFVAVAVVAAVVAAGLAATASAQDRYSDVDRTSVHASNIEALDRLGVFDGTQCGARRFCPGEAAQRWVIAVWIVRVIDGQDPARVKESRFADVDDSEWWMPYVERLADLQITVGCKQDPLRYCPDDTVTRAQMASFLVRAFRLQRAESAGFADTGGNTHEANIDALFAAGLTVGCRKSPLRYCPDRAVTRSQMASLLNRGLSGATGVGTGGQTGGTNPGTGTGTPASGSITVSQGPRSGDALIAASRGRACAVRSDETVTCWGDDEGFREHLSVSGLRDVVALSTANHPSDGLHSCAVHDDGDVTCWGSGPQGQLGTGSAYSDYVPVRVSGLYDAVAVAAGAGFSCAVHDDGDVSCWGTNRLGQLGIDTFVSGHSYPRRIPGLDDVVAISAGQRHSCAVHRDGALSCWGWVYGDEPTRVETPKAVTSVSIGERETCITTVDGLVFCWDYGVTKAAEMTQVANVTDAVKVSVGDEHACALQLSGAVSCWGRNAAGQLGDGTTTARRQAAQVSSITDAVDISVSFGSPSIGPHVCALHANRSVSCWGGNEIGQLQDGTLANRTTPKRVELSAKVPAAQVPFSSTELLQDWMVDVVAYWGRDFPWLDVAWDHIRDSTAAHRFGIGGDITVACAADPLGCTVTAMTITEMTLETVVHQLARVYDLHTGLADAREWGPAQLYFASRYPGCASGTNQHGAEVLADTLLHTTVPHAWLSYYQGRGCAGLPRTPSSQAELVLYDALDGFVPEWYQDNITTPAELWTAWRRGPSLPALANLTHEFGGLCTTWITTLPLIPPFPQNPPFEDFASC